MGIFGVITSLVGASFGLAFVSGTLRIPKVKRRSFVTGLSIEDSD
jgi:hypothetical protein